MTMGSARPFFMVLVVCVAVGSFVVGRTTAPSVGMAVGIGEGAVSLEVERQVGVAVERLEGRMPELVREGIVEYVREQEGRSGGQAAVWASLRSSLATVRSQLELYRIQHGDRFPSLEGMRGWSVMVQKTDAGGNVGAGATFGPYLMEGPENPLTGKSSVGAIGAATVEDGWAYDEKTGEFRGVMTLEVLKMKEVPAGVREKFEIVGVK